MRVRAKRASGVRLDFVNSYGVDRVFNAFRREEGDAPFVQLVDGEQRTSAVRLKPQTAPTAWLQFTLCTEPGFGTESCGWFGYGDARARPSSVSRCTLPPPSLAVGTAWSR